MEKVFASWSGGKDCSLAVNRALAKGLDVCYLANTITADGQHSCSHGMSAAVIRAQAQAMGIPILQQPTTDKTYREKFVAMLQSFREKGITGGVFGDIDFNAHKEWIDGVCAETGMTAHLPLWLEDQRSLMLEFIDAGFVAVVVSVKIGKLGPEILGRVIDRKFLDSLGKDITPCGEAGEYHSLVIDGPFFKKRLVITQGEKVTRGDHHFLEINAVELKTKRAKKAVAA
ncbi:MAG TPA: diphthine--ammonia ligase [Dehalococcoidales bacterium]|nr:diphthine--ammonia ligase [Dehalococcoidales bacterium]